MNSGSGRWISRCGSPVLARGGATSWPCARAYHGWTDLTDAVSTSIADNPNALTTRPAWVHTVDAPNSFRGTHADDPAGTRARRSPRWSASPGRARRRGVRRRDPVRQRRRHCTAGRLPRRGVHRRCARTAASPWQTRCRSRYGRLGEWFWGFERQGVVPDIVAVAKAMGNGHPLGAVITTPRSRGATARRATSSPPRAAARLIGGGAHGAGRHP